MHASDVENMPEDLVFSGLRIIDCGSFVASPVATTMLGDLGAEVIKIEPLGGDPYRNLYTAPGHPKGEHNYFWMLTNRNKKSIALDLKNDASRGVFEKLIRSADVFVTNMPLEVRARLATRYEDLLLLNERLIYASFTAYGEKGPQATKTGFDSTAWWSRSGMMDIIRPSADSPPARPAAATDVLGDSWELPSSGTGGLQAARHRTQREWVAAPSPAPMRILFTAPTRSAGIGHTHPVGPAFSQRAGSCAIRASSSRPSPHHSGRTGHARPRPPALHPSRRS